MPHIFKFEFKARWGCFCQKTAQIYFLADTLTQYNLRLSYLMLQSLLCLEEIKGAPNRA